MYLQGFQHGVPFVTTIYQGAADGFGVQGGEEVAVDGGAFDDALLHIDLELHFATLETVGALDVEFRSGTVNTFPVIELLRGDLPDALVVLQCHLIDLVATIHNMANHTSLKSTWSHERRHIIGDVGDTIPDGLNALGKNLIAVHGSRGNHLMNICVE